MMLLNFGILLLAVGGHTALWSTFVNRIHATTLPKAAIVLANIVGLGLLATLPVAYAWLLVARGFAWLVTYANPPSLALAQWYYYGCAAAGVVAAGHWTRRKIEKRDPPVLLRQSSTRHNMVARLGAHPTGRGLRRFMARLPGNECFQLEVSEKELEIPNLAAAFDGLSIVHLSDLHFSHAIDKEYFVEVVRIANSLVPDLVLVTGDLVDRRGCIDWIPDTLGHLRARFGTYAIFGNHDVRLKKDLARLHGLLTDCGVQYVGDRWIAAEIGSARILFAGNELPWFRHIPNLGDSPSRENEPATLRLLLAHSPDQYQWAREHDFDLMLAGHNHGGQVCLPVIGPIFSPSRSGVRYAGGVFHEPPTVLHVSRGISALDPIRYNCPPELAKLVLRAPIQNQDFADRERPTGMPVLAGQRRWLLDESRRKFRPRGARA